MLDKTEGSAYPWYGAVLFEVRQLALEQSSGTQTSRSWQRHNCGAEGVFQMPEARTRVHMVDASRGGFKLRFEKAEDARLALPSAPLDVMVINSDKTAFLATVLWTKDDLAGCRFYQHLSLDEVVTLMTESFKVQISHT